MDRKLKERRFAPSSIGMLLLFTALAAMTLLPFISIVLASFRPGREIMRQGLGLNLDTSLMTLDNYKLLFSGESDYFVWFANSLKLVVAQTVLTLFFSAFVAYGFAMYDFRGKKLIFGCVLLMMTTPMEILILPLYKLIISLKLFDKLAAVILPQLTASLPIFFFRQYLRGIPRDFVDAARVDGCSEFGIFFRVILPLMKPSFAAMGIFVGMNGWNAFLLPLILMNTNHTLPVGLNTLISPYKNNYDLLLAGSVFSVIPILILFMLFQRHFIAGMTAGGVKG